MILSKEYPDLLRIEDIKDILKINKGACYKLIHTGELKSFRVGKKTWLIPKHALEQYISSHL